MKDLINLELAKFIANYLLPKKGQMTGKEIAQFITNHADKLRVKLQITELGKVSETRVREIINLARRMNITKEGEIVSNSNGYWITNDKAEIFEYLQSWKERLSSQTKAIEEMEKSIRGYNPVGKTVTTNDDKKDLFDSL